jgi:hypothetical protein
MGCTELIGKWSGRVNPRDELRLVLEARPSGSARARRENLSRELRGVFVAEDADSLLKLFHFQRFF